MRQKYLDFFIPNKRIAILFIIIFFFMFFILPVVNCIEDHAVKHTFCEKFHICTVDYYASIPGYIFDEGGKTECTNVVSGWWLFLLTVNMIVFSYVFSCIIDFFYRKYRDI